MHLGRSSDLRMIFAYNIDGIMIFWKLGDWALLRIANQT